MSKRYSATQVRDILLQDASSEESASSDGAENSSSDDEDPSVEPTYDESNDGSHLSEEESNDDPVPTSSAKTVIRGRGSCGRGRGRGRGQPSGKLRSVVMPQTTSESQTWMSKNKTKWYKQPVKQPSGRQSAANIMHTPPGPTRYARKNVDGPLSAFQLFVRKALVAEILKWTNKEGRLIGSDNWKDVTEEEFLCFFGLLILSGVYKSRGESVIQLWSKEDGRAIFNKSMSRTRFQLISRAIRFDDAVRRRQNRNNDKLAPIKNIFEMWETTLADSFVPGDDVTVDEQLLTYRGRVPFKQYIPSKPGKYGIKIWMLCDSTTSYVLRLQIYSGKQAGQGREQNQGERVVLQLTEDLKGSGRNVTVDNFFSSLSLAQKLSKKQMTLLGTIRKNRTELPPEFVTVKGREVLSSLFAFRDDATLVSYCPKKGKVVTLLSSMHTQPEVNETRPDKKPLMITDYNATKGGVDTADQMLRIYSTKRMTRRWPMAVFYNMLDISAMNAFLVWISLYPDWMNGTRHRRRMFLLQLGKHLIQAGTLTAPTMNPIIQDVSNTTEPPKKRSRCYNCPRDKDVKTSTVCVSCSRYVCKEHSKTVCTTCE